MRVSDSPLNSHLQVAYYEGKINHAEWIKADKYRLYSKVFTVSDVTTGDGKLIDYGVSKVDRFFCERKVDWSVQGNQSLKIGRYGAGH